MRVLSFILAILVVSALAGTRAEAQNYPWCSIYTGSMGGAKNCGFSSFQQCMANVSGIGGFCQLNDTYSPPSAAPARHKPHKHS